MKKKLLNPTFIIISILIVFGSLQTFALLRRANSGAGSIKTSSWSVTRSQSQNGDSIDLVAGGATDNYILTVQSSSEVDVIYSIIISNLPSGVEVDLDNSGNYRSPVNGTITIRPAGTINYNDQVKTKNHTLTFRAGSETNPITNREIDIDVEFKQAV
jgi:hypothetical protein